MSDRPEENAANPANAVDPSAAAVREALDLDLSPSWARRPPQAHRYADHAGAGDGEESVRPRRERRERPWNEARERRGEGRDERRRPQRPDRREERLGERPGRADRASSPREQRPSSAAAEPRPHRDGHTGHGPRPPRDAAPSLPVDVRVLPEPKALSSIVRRIQTTHRAYPLRDLARLFLDNPTACLVRLEGQGEAPPRLCQCRVCGVPALSPEEIQGHAAREHFDHFFDAEDIQVDAPAGNFVCVVRCGLSGELLGPPNHHSFGLRVQELLRSRYPNLTEDAYRSHFEMVRDPAVVEQWREQCRRQRVYRRKPGEDGAGAPAAPAPAEPASARAAPADARTGAAAPAADPAPAADAVAEAPRPPLDRQTAEAIFVREILPGLVTQGRHVLFPVSAVHGISDHRLSQAVRDALNREDRYPTSLAFALRGAFRHRGLHLFRVNEPRGPDFVMAREPSALDALHAVSDVRLALEHVQQNPGCTRGELLEQLAPGDAANPVRQHLATQLNWLVEKGHVIEYFNGVLAPPADNPVFRALPAAGPSPGTAAS